MPRPPEPQRGSLWTSLSASSGEWLRSSCRVSRRGTGSWSTAAPGGPWISVPWTTSTLRTPRWQSASPPTPSLRSRSASGSVSREEASSGSAPRTPSECLLWELLLLNCRFSGLSFTSHTKIHPTNTKIRFFDTSLLDTDSIIVKVRKNILLEDFKLTKSIWQLSFLCSSKSVLHMFNTWNMCLGRCSTDLR